MRARRSGRGFAALGRRVAGAAVTVVVAVGSIGSLVALDAGMAAADPPATPTRFVATTGNDNVPANNPCTNPATPCRTIQRAINVSVDNADTVQVAAGTYAEKPSINKRISIKGAGSAAVGGTIIDAVNSGIVVTSNPGGTTNLVTIDGVRIVRGASTIGGVFVASGRLDLRNSVVTTNTGTTFGGGLLVFNGASLNLTDTDVTANTAQNGGGILSLGGGPVTITGGSISGNTATAASGIGGGILVTTCPAATCGSAKPAGTVSITSATVANNTATAFGGGIYSLGAATVDTTSFESNKETAVGLAGGGGAVFGAPSTVSNSSFTGNTGVLGGGIYNATQLTLTNTDFSTNASNDGGGVFVASGGSTNVTGGSFDGNTSTGINNNAATGFGGGIYNTSTAANALTVSGAAFDSNKALTGGNQIGSGGAIATTGPTSITNSNLTNNSAANGGGLYTTGSTSITGATLDGNTATPTSTANGFGGGIYATKTLTTNDATISNNKAATGGGIFNLQGKLTATGGSVSNNTVTAVPSGPSTGLGGGIYNLTFTTPTGLSLSGVTVTGNVAKSAGSGSTLVAGNAGGLYNLGFSTIGNSSFADNTAEGSAGALYNAGGTIALTATPFSGNSSPGVGGSILDGGVAVSGNPTMTFTDSPIQGAGTAFLGGGIAIGAASKVEMHGGGVSGGAAVSGGGVYVAQTGANATNEPGGQLTTDDTDVTGNTATIGLGGGIFNGGKVTASDGEISNNSAPSTAGGSGLGAGVYSAATANASQPNPAPAELTLSRTTLAGNTGNGGSAITASGPTTLRNSTVNGNASTSTAGAIFVSGATTLSNDTIVGNTAGAGGGSTGGIVRAGGATTVTGSIVAQNGGNCFGTIVDGGYNLTDTVAPAAGACAFTSNADVGDPQLNALGNNGGPTPTMLPKANSPAINKIPSGNAACPATDQRGVIRPQGVSCDIGSVELEGIVAPTLNGPDHALFVIGTPNSVGFTYTGVPKPTLSTTGDALPNGITLTDNDDGTATLGGTAAPGTAGVYHFTIKAASGEPPDATIDFTLTVIAPLTITTTSLSDGEVNVPYTATLQATGGTTPYTWSIDSGNLPAGLSLNPATGAITGTPTGPEGPSTFTVKVVDSTDAPEQPQSATKQLTISIKAATTLSAQPAILHLALPSLKLSIINASATLTKAPGNQPVAGQPIRFVAGSQQLCVAVTDANGFAKCPPTNVNGILSVLLANGYNAFFDGTATLKPSSGHGGLVSG